MLCQERSTAAQDSNARQRPVEVQKNRFISRQRSVHRKAIKPGRGVQKREAKGKVEKQARIIHSETMTMAVKLTLERELRATTNWRRDKTQGEYKQG